MAPIGLRLSIKTPKATSLARTSGFNQHNIRSFSENFESVIKQYDFQPHIWNMNGNAVTTVRKPDIFVARKGFK